MTPTMRDFQAEDFQAVLAQHAAGHRCVLIRAATGLGKAVLLAFLAQHYAKTGRVLVLVDTRKLVRQLAATIRWVTGISPGVEMGEERASNGRGWAAADRIVVGTVQTQYAGPKNKEGYRQFDPSEFSAVLLDECELFLAAKSRSVVEWFLDGNPTLLVDGCTATPLRTDGVAMGELFDTVAVDRDIVWGIENGWLVKPRQGFVRVSLDLSTLKVRKGDDGEPDFSEDEVAEKINNEKTLMEMAKGIVGVAEDRRTIVVCPKVEIAKAVTDYINGERMDSARCIYGELSDDQKDHIFLGHRRGDFQFLVSVSMLTKGYDDPEIRCVVNCRKTKSKRLYTQIVGRSTRPLKNVVDGLATPAERMAAIAASAKPDALMVNMVGIRADVRDFTIVDLLGTTDDETIAERAKLIAEEDGLEADDALEIAADEVEAEREQMLAAAERAAASLDDEDEAAAIRKRIDVKANVDIELTDDLRIGPSAGKNATLAGIPEKQLNILRKAKLTDSEIQRLSPDEAKDLSRDIVRRWKAGLCSIKQARCLRKFGWSDAEVENMTFEAASEAMSALAANNWRRPLAVA